MKAYLVTYQSPKLSKPWIMDSFATMESAEEYVKKFMYEELTKTGCSWEQIGTFKLWRELINTGPCVTARSLSVDELELR